MPIPAIKPSISPALQPVTREVARTVAVETARRLGWQGVVSGGKWVVALESVGTEVAAEGLGATLWGIARIGLPILTLGFVMEGDTSHKPLRANDFPKPQPDSKFVTQLELDFLKQQKQLAQLSGNKSLAQLLNLLILQRSADLTPAQFPGQNIVTGALNMVASAGDTGGAAAANGAMSPEEQEARRKLKSADPATQWQGWETLYNLNPSAAKQVTQADLGPAAPFVTGTQGVKKYLIRGSREWEGAAWEIADLLEKRYADSHQATILDIRLTHPSHSLMDFMPEPYSTHFAHDPIMELRFQFLHYLQGLHDGSRSAAEVLPLFLGRSVNSNWQPISIIQLPSGIYIIRDGHHRLAALVKAAREGIIPEDWLKQVSVDLLVIPEDFPIPEPVFLQIYAPAHTLTLEELLPPHILQPK